MTAPRLLDAFCSAGGATRGYQMAGFHVTGIDIDRQPNYCGDGFILDDARAALADAAFVHEFDAVAASPPCQGYSSKSPDQSKHDRLIGEVRDMLEATGLPYVIENVEGARSDMRNPVQLCGSSFGLDVRRHRLFETNWPLVGPPCNHAWQTPRFDVYDHGKHYKARTVPVFGTGGGKARAHWPAAMGIDWMTDAELAEAIPPAYTSWIGNQLSAYLRARV